VHQKHKPQIQGDIAYMADIRCLETMVGEGSVVKASQPDNEIRALRDGLVSVTHSAADHRAILSACAVGV
jgi:hypothetical protein